MRRGLSELDGGAGRPQITRTDPTLIRDLERLVDPDVRGDPQGPLRWSSKSGAKLAEGLRGMERCRGWSSAILRLPPSGLRPSGLRRPGIETVAAVS